MITRIGLLLLLLSCCFLPSLRAQVEGTKSKRALKQYEKAREAIKKRDFEKGMKYLQSAVDTDPNFFEAHYSLGTNYRILLDRQHPEYAEKSAYHLRKAAEILPNSIKHYRLYFQVAELAYREGDYQEAKDYYAKFLKLGRQNDRNIPQARRNLASCEFAIEGMKNPLDFDPQPLPDPINQLGLQYFPTLTGDREEIIFTGRNSPSPRDDENIYISRYRDSVWTKPVIIEAISSPFNEGTCTISADGSTMIFTICEGNRDRQVLGRCDLFITYRKGTRWTHPKNLGSPVNTRHWESQPALSADGSTLFFVSDRPGGYGGTDIWITKRREDGTWEKPQNAGNTLNTSGEEVAPFIHTNNQTLFFASDGHLGYGALDLFKSEYDGTGWQKPQNLGYPINTFRNQVGLFVATDGKTAYYSDEEIAMGRIESSVLHSFELPEEIRVRTASRYVRGVVYDAQTQQPIEAQVALYDLSKEQVENAVTSDAETGKYLITLNQGAEYALHANRDKYLFKSVALDYSKEDGGDLEMDIYLDPVKIGSKTILKNIFFETASWELVEKSRTELRLLADFLQKNADLRIEVSGHTDDVGSDSDNLVLSDKRAKSVRSFLIEQGIAAERIETKGYGEQQPIVPNNSPENRAKNRRIEFKVL